MCYLVLFVIVVIAVVCISRFRGLSLLIENFLSYLDNYINIQNHVLWRTL